MDPGRLTSGYYLEAISLGGVPLSKLWADLEDYDVIFAYFRVRFRVEVWFYSSKTCLILLIFSLIIISLSLSGCNIP
jgi:hypothetical protein